VLVLETPQSAAQAPAYNPWIGSTYNVSFQRNFILKKKKKLKAG
jgi:hypothetical protein